MRIRGKELKKVKVYTESGMFLGIVSDVEIDNTTATVVHFFVQSANPIAGLFEDALMIHRDDVIDLNKKQMVVKDQAGKRVQADDEIAVQPQSESAPTMSTLNDTEV